MNELELKYGCNPNQKPARIFMRDGSDLPLTPSPVPTSGPGVRTGCAPTGTGRPSPTCATPPPPGI